MDTNDNSCELLEKVISSVQRKNDKDKTKDSLLAKQAKVVGYDSEAHKAVIYFLDDIYQVNYTVYNKTGEILSEGDSVKVYYTTNPAKGWIGLRLGEPNIKEVKQIIPYSSHSFVNGNDTDISDLVSSPLNLNFTTIGNTSDTVAMANQVINVTKSGTISTEYYVDGIKSDNVHIEKKDVGTQVITHIVPMSVLAGDHNLLIRQSSGDGARGICKSGELFGVVSGQLDSLRIEEPPNDNIILSIEAVLGEQFTLYPLSHNNSSQAVGLVYWGDGTNGAYSSGISSYHIYGSAEEQLAIGDAEFTYKGIQASLSDIEALTDSKAGDIWDIGTTDSYIKYFRTANKKWAVMTSFGSKQFFKITITAKIVLMANGYKDYQDNNVILKEIIFSDYVQEISWGASLFDRNKNLTSVKFGKNVRKIGDKAFRSSGISGVVKLPPNLETLEEDAFATCPSITAVIAECPYLWGLGYNYGVFRSCHGITTVVWNAPNLHRAFENCENLSKVTLGDNLIQIGWSAFYNCSALSEITIPKSVTSIGHHSFVGTNIREVTLPPNCTYYREGASFQSFPNGCVIHGGVPIT